MTTILPEKNKAEIKKTYLFGFVSKSIFALFIVTLILLVFKVAIFYTIDIEEGGLRLQFKETEESEKLKLMEDQKEKIKETEKIVELFSFDTKKKTEVLNFVFKIKPNSLIFNSVSIQEDGEKIKVVISGVSDSRDSLLSFYSFLESSVFVEEIDLPASSFAKNFEIPFSLNFIYKYE